jgi:hypothetical protein
MLAPSMAIKTARERKYKPQEIADEYGLHVKTVRDLFLNKPGVIRIGHPAREDKRRHFTLRIPESVVRRVFGALTVKQ